MGARTRFFLIAAFLAAGCGAPGNDHGGLVITDDAGRSVRVAVPATRVVSLLPAFTEILFAIGAGDHVVGRSRFDVDPPAALDVPSVGDGLAPNVEAIVARNPDLVLIYRAAANEDAVAQLERLGIPVVALRTDRLDDVPRTAMLLGRLTGSFDSAVVLADRFTAALDSARQTPLPDDAPTALILAWDQPPIVIGAGSFQSELVRLAGYRNVFADVLEPSAQVTLETIVVREPDVVVTTAGDSVPSWARRPEWQAIEAVRRRRFIRFDGTAFGHPSFRVFAAIRQLEAQHP